MFCAGVACFLRLLAVLSFIFFQAANFTFYLDFFNIKSRRVLSFYLFSVSFHSSATSLGIAGAQGGGGERSTAGVADPSAFAVEEFDSESFNRSD